MSPSAEPSHPAASGEDSGDVTSVTNAPTQVRAALRKPSMFKTSTVVQLPGADCTVQNCIYLISCLKCSVQYVGKCSSGKHGDRQLKHRISEHRGTIVNEKIDKAVGEHFNSRGHQLSDFSYVVLEVVNNPDPEYLKEREALYIRKFDTKRNGLNKSY